MLKPVHELSRTRWRVHACVYDTYTHIDIYIYMHTCICTYINIYMCVCAGLRVYVQASRHMYHYRSSLCRQPAKV